MMTYEVYSWDALASFAPEYIQLSIIPYVNYKVVTAPEDTPYTERIQFLGEHQLWPNLYRKQFKKDGIIYYIYPDTQ